MMRFAALAVLIHVLLLAIPIQRAARSLQSPAIEIRLLTRPAEPTEFPEVTVPAPNRFSMPAAIPPAGTRQGSVETPDPGPTLSTALLLEQARRLQVPAPGAAPAVPGRHHGPPPPAWSRRLLEPATPLFNEELLPSEPEIMDRWQEPGGMKRVVMRLPSGQTLCGRVESWDPMNPLVEPIAMFHLCAGGGRRSGPTGLR